MSKKKRIYNKLSKIEWANIKFEYVSSINQISYKALAKKYNCSVRSLAERGSKENWTKQRVNIETQFEDEFKPEFDKQFFKRMNKQRLELVNKIDDLLKIAFERLSKEMENNSQYLSSVADLVTFVKLKELLISKAKRRPPIRNITINLSNSNNSNSPG